MASCIDDMRGRGYLPVPRTFAFFVDNSKAGKVIFKDSLTVLEYGDKAVRNVKLHMRIAVSYVGTNPFTQYTCACASGVRRVVVWVLNPMQAIASLVQLAIMLTLLTTLRTL